MKITFQDDFLTIKNGEKIVVLKGTKVSETITQFEVKDFQRAIKELKGEEKK